MNGFIWLPRPWSSLLLLIKRRALSLLASTSASSLDMGEQSTGASVPPEPSMGGLNGLVSMHCRSYNRGAQHVDLHMFCLQYEL